MDLSQAEADALLAMEKIAADSDVHEFPGIATGVIIRLVSKVGREEFFLDIKRGRIDLAKATYQN
ncbi:MAG TPA: hypothetical protein VNL92_08090, partial [Dehalococcoidia bacterium]|nr:hypothetical protein [Dehalococcoidia bacterium]